jgi:hypothetical protein
MTTPHRYTLEPYKTPKSRHVCPRCQHRNKTFKRYIDTETGQHLADHVGRCDREDSCGYHYTPREYFKAEPYNKPAYVKPLPPPRPKPHDVLPPWLLRQSCNHYERNNFAWFLGSLFEPDLCHELTAMYHIGTSIHWPGATVFWQVDVKGCVRTGKVMLYNSTTGKRVKEPFNHIAWVHRLVGSKQLADNSGQLPVSSLQNQRGTANCQLKTANFSLKQCLFGEHLLNNMERQPVALVESEKTAIIAAGYLPDYTWLATGGISNLNADKCKVLAGREVILYPDANAYDKWTQKARELQRKIPTAKFHVSNYLQQNATPQQLLKGIDIADMYLDGIS